MANQLNGGVFVVDEDDVPLANASVRVVITFSDNSRHDATVSTNSMGWADVSALLKDRVLTGMLMVTKSGYRKAKLRCHILWQSQEKDWVGNLGVSTVYLYAAS